MPALHLYRVLSSMLALIKNTNNYNTVIKNYYDYYYYYYFYFIFFIIITITITIIVVIIIIIVIIIIYYYSVFDT